MSFLLQKIGSKIIEYTDYGVDVVVPNPDHTRGDPMLKRMTGYGFNLTSYSSATPWDGTPRSETSFGWGH